MAITETWAGVIPRAANPRHAAKDELRHCGAYSSHDRIGCGRQTSVWMGSGQAHCGIRFPPARTGNVRSAARAQARLRPNLRARLQLTSSWSPRSRDSRLLPMAMVGNRSCQRIKIYVVNVYIEAGFWPRTCTFFASSKCGTAWQCAQGRRVLR